MGRQGTSISSQSPPLRIGELARRAGIPAATLRAWERRYGVVEPLRADSGYRLYSPEDERRVRRMVELISTGIAPAEAAEQIGRADAPGLAPDDLDADQSREVIEEALLRFDDGIAHAEIDRALALWTVDKVVDEILMPLLASVGLKWAAGEASVAQEHFTSNLIRGRLLGMARDWGTGEGPKALLACPSGEQHDVSLIAFGILLAERGWRVTFLGADTPGGTIDDAARRIEPQAVVLAMVAPRDASLARAAAAAVEYSPLLLAGPAATAELAAAVGAELRFGSVADVARMVDREHGQPVT